MVVYWCNISLALKAQQEMGSAMRVYLLYKDREVQWLAPEIVSPMVRNRKCSHPVIDHFRTQSRLRPTQSSTDIPLDQIAALELKTYSILPPEVQTSPLQLKRTSDGLRQSLRSLESIIAPTVSLATPYQFQPVDLTQSTSRIR
jgi:hypothetical protein